MTEEKLDKCNKVTIKVDIDTKEAQEQLKELNEQVADVLGKLCLMKKRVKEVSESQVAHIQEEDIETFTLTREMRKPK